MEIAEFLLARIAEDEALALRNSGDRGLGDEGSFPDYRTYSDADTDAADDYLRNFNPRRVLVECEAKRAIVELHQPMRAVGYVDCKVCREPYEGEAESYPCDTLRLLAAPYANHPDCDPAWGIAVRAG